MTRYKDFKVSKLFDIHPTKAYKVPNRELLNENGTTPVVSNTSKNNGIIGMSSLQPLEDGGILTFSDTVDANTIFYQPYPFIGYAHVQGMYPYDATHWTERALMYFQAVFAAIARQYGFDYGNKFNREIAADMDIPLPVKGKLVPDWAAIRSLSLSLSSAEEWDVAMSNIDTSQWQEFKLSDLFYKVPTSKVPYKAGDLPSEPDNDYSLPCLTAGVTNQGLSRYVKPNESYTVLSNVISVSANGQNTGAMFYQPDDFVVLQDAYALKLVDTFNVELDKPIALFLIAVIQQTLKAIGFDWTNKAGWERIKDITIKLPAVSVDEPDWEFMEKEIDAYKNLYIEKQKARNEQEYDKKLEKSDLADTTITAADGSFIAMDKQKAPFRLGTLFTFDTPKKKYNANALDHISVEVADGLFPYVVRGKFNNGIKGYISADEEMLNPARTISFGQDTATVFYQPEPYFTGDKIKIMNPIGFSLTENIALYYLTAIRNAFINATWGSTSYKVELLKDANVILPIKDGVSPDDATVDDIDYDYMERYIDILKRKKIESVYQERISQLSRMATL